MAINTLILTHNYAQLISMQVFWQCRCLTCTCFWKFLTKPTVSLNKQLQLHITEVTHRSSREQLFLSKRKLQVFQKTQQPWQVSESYQWAKNYDT